MPWTCSISDFAINVFAPRAKSVWSANERKLGRGFAGVPVDNVGVQYGLSSLRAGAISPAQFVDLNARIGGLDIDINPTTQRITADPTSAKVIADRPTGVQDECFDGIGQRLSNGLCPAPVPSASTARRPGAGRAMAILGLVALACLACLGGLASPGAAKLRRTTIARTVNQPVAKTVIIGHSVEHRPITAVVIGPNSSPRKLLLVGCIHGNECAGLRILHALRQIRPPTGVQLWLVGELNPDGTTAGTRQNAHGVDLNRNFPYQWAPVTDPTYYSGPKALSEPESRAAVKLIRRIKPAVTIWYHQHEDLVDMAGGDRGVARRYAQLAHLRATCLPFLPGTAPAWSNHTFPGTTSFVIELPAGPVGNAALSAHRRAVRAIERGQRSGSRTSCAP